MPVRSVKQLRVHPFNTEVYGQPDNGLAESLEQFGLKYPIEIDQHDQILSGARRWTAAKRLGWTDIEVRVVGETDKEDIRRHILLANAYRSVKSMFVRQKEADAYHDLLDRGEVTQDDLVGLATQHGKAPTTPEDLKPRRLAAAAAGMSATTYQRAAFVTDPARGEAEINQAEEKGLISSDQALELTRKLKRVRSEFRTDRISADRAASEIRKDVRQAKVDYGYDAQERAKRAADEAAMETIRKGRVFIDSISRLGHAQHARHLGPRVAFQLAGIVYEAGQALQALARKAKLTLPTKPAELEESAKSPD